MALNTDCFVGPEAEGHLKGVRTLFVRSGHCMIDHGFPHLFFTKEYKEWPEVVHHLDVGNCVITVETWAKDFDEIPHEVLTRAHILVRLPFDLRMMKLTDSIIVGGDYYGRTFQVGTGIESTVDDYMSDEIRDIGKA